MKRERILNYIGFGLLGVCYLFSLCKIFVREKSVAETEVTIRFAHWQLESGLQTAFDEIAKEYMTLHPEIKVVQLAVPEKVYATWLTTQLVGGTPPDLIQLGMGNLPDEKLARYFVPLSSWVEQPNPYNKGTELEDIPWRDTFVDGLKGSPNFNTNLLEFFAVPNSMHTVRVYYNSELYKKIAGDAPLPSNFEEFVTLCLSIETYNRSETTSVYPVAGSKSNAGPLVNTLFLSQTQKLRRSLDIARRWEPSTVDMALAYLNESWSLRNSPVLDGLQLAHDAGQFMQPGFMQLGREDASFYFLQGRALMIAAGSWDAPTFLTQAKFPVSAFRVPLPRADDPRYSANMFGVPSEADIGTTNSFGLTRASRNPEATLDFLRFLTSKASNQKFVRISGWLPSVAGVEPGSQMKIFAPVSEGATPGFGLDLGPETRRIRDNSYYLLFKRDGSAEQFVDSIESKYRKAVLDDVRLSQRVARRSTQTTDSLLGAALAENTEQFSTPLEADPHSSLLLESQTSLEQRWYWAEYNLQKNDKKRD